MKLNTPMPLKESSHYSQEEIQLDHHININAIDMIQTEIKDIKERIKKGEIGLEGLLQIREGELSVAKIRAIISGDKF